MQLLRLHNFRCFEQAELPLHPEMTVITGGNGAGKTTLLEAVHILGRGRSFRSPEQRSLIREGAETASLSGTVANSAGDHHVAIRIAPDRIRLEVDGDIGTRAVDLVRLMPLQLLAGGIMDLVDGSPDGRRRLLDWGLFHVEHQYLAVWQRFRRALAQRNAGLRSGAPPAELKVWDHELAEAGEAVHAYRGAYMARLAPAFTAVAMDVLGIGAQVAYRPGWPEGRRLDQVLAESLVSDMAQGLTRAGPHRADLIVELDSARARRRSSRGQLKLLGASLVLGQTKLVAQARGEQVVMLVDEPDADLDRSSATRLLNVLQHLPVQLIIATIAASETLMERAGGMFHVEHGTVKALL